MLPPKLPLPREDAVFHRHSKIVPLHRLPDTVFVGVFEADKAETARLDALFLRYKAKNRILFRCFKAASADFISASVIGYSGEGAGFVCYIKKGAAAIALHPLFRNAPAVKQ